jgi:hypothetical protein
VTDPGKTNIQAKDDDVGKGCFDLVEAWPFAFEVRREFQSNFTQQRGRQSQNQVSTRNPKFDSNGLVMGNPGSRKQGNTVITPGPAHLQFGLLLGGSCRQIEIK